MKVKKSLINSSVAFISNIVAIIIGLISQAVFINILGAEYLGINGLFNNIVSMLALVELGIGSAITFNLYKPLVKNDIPKIKSLMSFYRKSYHIIAIIVLIIGISLIPFLKYLIADVSIDVSINHIYIFFIIDLVCSYLLSYKRNILYADQKNYIINIVHIFYLLLLNILQLSLLALTKNYYLYLIIKILMRILENVIICYIVNKKYNYLQDSQAEPLDKNIERDIFQKVKALVFHKIGSFIVTGTDNIIISKFLGVITVGLYSNYFLIINSVSTLFSQIIISTTSSIGHLLVEDNKQKNFEVFKKIRFIGFWLACFASICILMIMESFVSIWVGEQYLLPTSVLIILSINLFQTLMRYGYSAFKEAAGIYYEDRFVPLVESIINIIASIILCKLFGLAGVFMGTIISGLALWCYSYPKYVYKKLFNRNYSDYTKETIGYILLFVILASGTYYSSLLINVDNIYLKFISNVVISLVIPNLVLLLIFYKTDNFKYYLNLLKSFSKKKVKS